MVGVQRKPRDVSYVPVRKLASADEVGDLIRCRRKELGYTQEQVASFMGCSPRLIGEVERGRTTVAFQTLFDLAQGLGIDFTLAVRGAR